MIKLPRSFASKLLLLLVLPGVNASAQNDDMTNSASPPKTESAPSSNGELPPPKLPVKKNYTDAQIKKECQKYEGKYISYYEHVFKVEKCKRRDVASDDSSDMSGLPKGGSIIVVESDTIAMIPESFRVGENPASKVNCGKIEGRYVLSRGDDVFFIEKCKKRLIPDWDTYTDHSGKRGARKQDILELTDMEYSKLPDGEPFESSLDAEFKKQLKDDSSSDVLPLAEACKGLNGKFMAYYSKLYKIEKCHKHPIDPSTFSKRFPGIKPEEMSSGQWVSLPTGKVVK